MNLTVIRRRRSSELRFLLIVLTLPMLLAGDSLGQNSSTILQGQVLDGTGTAISAAMLQWSAVGVSGNGTGNSDAQGNFAFELPIVRGTFTVQISVSANLYVPTQVEVQVTAGGTTTVPITLSLKPTSQLATVS